MQLAVVFNDLTAFTVNVDAKMADDATDEQDLLDWAISKYYPEVTQIENYRLLDTLDEAKLWVVQYGVAKINGEPI